MMRPLLLAMIVLLALAARGEGAVGCGSGYPQYEDDVVRIFETRDREDVPTWWACSTRVRTPRKLVVLSPGVTNELYIEGRFGNRIAYTIESFADGGGNWDAGWFDVRTGRSALATTDTRSKEDFTSPVASMSVRPDGSMAYVLRRSDDEGEDVGFEIAYRPYSDGRFGKERLFGALPIPELEPATLSLGGDEITWRTQGATRQIGAAPGPAAPATRSRGRRLPRSICRSGKTLFVYGVSVVSVRRGPHRGIFICRAGKRGSVVRVTSDRPRVSHVQETDRQVVFALAPHRRVPGGALAQFSLRTNRLRIAELPLGADGKPAKVLAVVPGSGVLALTDTPSILFLPPKDPLRELIRLQPREIEPSTLALGRGTATWREVGEPRRLALS